MGREDPRVARSRSCILAAASEALSQDGAAGVTVEGVAERAGVAKTTVYRLWADRDELLLAAFECLTEVKAAYPDTGDLRADLIGELRALDVSVRTESWGRALPALIDRSEREPAMAELARQLSERRRSVMIDRLTADIDAGRLRPDADPELMTTQLIGSVFFRRFFSRQPFPDAEIAELVDRVVGAAAPAVTPTGSPRRATSSGSVGRARSRD